MKPQPSESLCHVSEMHRDHQDVGQALVALMLEVMLRQPEGVEAHRIHLLGYGFRLVEDRRQLLVGIASLVGGRSVLAHVAQINVPGIHRNELPDHGADLPIEADRSICHNGEGNAMLVGCAVRL